MDPDYEGEHNYYLIGTFLKKRMIQLYLYKLFATNFCGTSTIKKFIILWHYCDVMLTFNNSLVIYSYSYWDHVLSRIQSAQYRYVAALFYGPFPLQKHTYSYTV